MHTLYPSSLKAEAGGAGVIAWARVKMWRKQMLFYDVSEGYADPALDSATLAVSGSRVNPQYCKNQREIFQS